MITVKNFLLNHRMSYVIYLNDVDYTFVKPWFYFVSLFFPLNHEDIFYFFTRIPAAILALSSWILIRKSQNLIYKPSRLSLTISASLFIIFCFEFLISARPDATYTLGNCLLIYASLQSLINRRLLPFFIYLFLLPFFIASHPMGTYFVPTTLISIYFCYSSWTKNQKIIVGLLVVLAGIGTIPLTLWDLSVEQFIAAYRAASDGHHSLGIRDELLRLKLLADWSQSLYIIFICNLIAVFALWPLHLKNYYTRFIFFNLLLSLSFLAIFPSKWCYYYSLLLSPLILLNGNISELLIEKAQLRNHFSDYLDLRNLPKIKLDFSYNNIIYILTHFLKYLKMMTNYVFQYLKAILKLLRQNYKIVPMLAFIYFCFYSLNYVMHTYYFFEWNRYSVLAPFVLLVVGLYIFAQRQSQLRLMWIIPAMILCLSEQFNGIFGVTLFLLISYVVGSFLVKQLKIKSLDQLSALEQILICIFIGLGLLSYLEWFFVHFKVNYKFIYYGIVSIVLFLGRNSLKQLSLQISEVKSINISYGQKIIFLIGCIFLVYALVPYYVFEELNAYFHIPKLILKEGYFVTDTNFVVSFLNNFSCFQLFTINLFLGGEYACRLILFFCFIASLLLLERSTRRIFDSQIALLTILIFVSIPALIFSIAGSFLDVIDMYVGAVLYILFLQNYSSEESTPPKEIIFFFFVAALGFLLRLQVAILIVPLSLLLSYKAFKLSIYKDHAMTKGIFLGTILFLGLFSPGMIKNYLFTDNPFFPQFNEFFKSPFFTIEPLIKNSLGTIPKLSIKLLHDITFKFNQKYLYLEYHQFGFGFLFYSILNLVPVMLFKKSFRTKYLTSIFIVIAAFIIYHTVFFQIRYFYSAMPVCALLVAGTFKESISMINEKAFRFIGLLFFSALLTANFLFQYQSHKSLNFGFPLLNLITKNYNGHPLQEWDDIKKFYSVANGILGPNKKALIYYSPTNFFADFKVEGYEWYFYQTAQAIKKAKGDPDKIYDTIFRDLKFDAIIIVKGNHFPLTDYDYLQQVYSYGDYSLWVPKQKFKFDETLTFGENGNGLPLLQEGWQIPDINLSWTKKDRSRILLSLARYRNIDIEVILHLVPLVYGNVKSQKLKISVNEVDLVHGIYNKEEYITLKIPKSLNSGSLEIELYHPDYQKIKDLGINPKDHREVSIQLIDLVVKRPTIIKN